jgi:molybdopterin/thiamine biosynthesis adenylyltransferase
MFQRNPKQREILRDKKVCIVGCGSIGSALADMLVRSGVEHFTLIDSDEFSQENLARHVLTPRALDKNKADALSHHLMSVNPSVYVNVCPSKVEDARITPLDIFISCVDSYRAESYVNQLALNLGVPAVFVGCWGAARTGEIFVARGKPCYECYASFRAKEDIPVDPKKYTDPKFDETKIPGQEGLWANILIISGIAFKIIYEVLSLPANTESPLFLFNIDGSDFKPLTGHSVPVNRGCAVCDPAKVAELTI